MFRIFVALALVAGTASADDAFVAGNRAAVAGDAKAAVTELERAVHSGWSSPALFDLGNAYTSAGDKARAILAYERAQLLAPNDPAIARNLARVRAEAGLAAPASPPALDRAIATLTTDDWTWLAVGAGALACIGIIALGWGVGRRAARAVVVTGLAATAGCALAAVHTAPSRAHAIVLTRDEARLAPVATADPVFTAPAGADVDIVQRHGEFVRVREGDRTGWLPRDAVESVVR